MKEKVIGPKVLRSNTGREEALKRFGLISPLLEEGLCASELARRRCLLLEREGISERTLRRWLASYKEEGFKAILRYGAPKSIYVDNGKIFTSTWFQLACAKLNIRHLRTSPYNAESKGKIERFNRTVESFLDESSLQKPQTLSELNSLFSAWLSEAYNISSEPANEVSCANRLVSSSINLTVPSTEEHPPMFLPRTPLRCVLPA